MKRLQSRREFLKLSGMAGVVFSSGLFNGMVQANYASDEEFYFVHGFYPSPKNKENIFATTEYGITFPSVVGTGSLIAAQFHVEKSGKAGLKLLSNFCKWKPC